VISLTRFVDDYVLLRESVVVSVSDRDILRVALICWCESSSPARVASRPVVHGAV